MTMAFLIPFTLIIDVYHLGRAMTQSMAVLLVSLGHGVYKWLHGATEQRSDQQITMLELQCMSWMLRISLDKAVHLLIMKHLATMMTLANFDPTLVMDCFNAFISCIKVDTDTHEVVIVQGLEKLATTSALCLLNTLSHLLVIDPTSSVVEDVRQCYIKVLSAKANFHGHQFYHTMNSIRCLFVHWRERSDFSWDDYKLSANEYTIVTSNLVRVAQFGYQRVRKVKVPRWILRFTLHSLSLDPPPPMPVIVDCLLTIAIELGCDLSNTRTVAPDER